MEEFYKKYSLKDKVTVITGGASGLGKATVDGFLEAGAKVVIWDINCNLTTENKKNNKVCLNINITDKQSVISGVKETLKIYKRIDVLVNCAGITKRMPSENFDEKVWDNIINVNLKGTFLCCKYIGKEMLKLKSGSIINFGSLGSFVAIPKSLAYCSSKGGVAQLTKTLAVEWAQRGVRVNGIAPGTFETPLLKQCIKDDPDYAEKMLSRFPIGRFGKPEEIIGSCIFLASDASSYITGHILVVDGGCTAY